MRIINIKSADFKNTVINHECSFTTPTSVRVRQLTQLDYWSISLSVGQMCARSGNILVSRQRCVRCRYTWIHAAHVVCMCVCVFLWNALLDPLLPRRRDNSRDSIGRLGKLVKSGCDWLHTYARLSNVSRAWIYIFAQCCVFMRHTIRLWPTIFSLHI